MKKAGLLILILLTAYIGGIYEDPALMALAELLLAVVMWLLAGYMAGRLELQIPAARILAVRGQTFQCRVTVKSRGILPVSRFVVRIGSRYEGGGRREDKKVYGGAMPGESRLWVEERADHCGIRTFQAEEIRVYDYLALFSRKRKLGQAWEALILPPDMELRGLLRVCSGVSVFWYDEGEAGGKGRCVRWEMTDESGRPALFEKLYRTRWPEESRRGTRIEQVAGSVREAGAVSSAEDILTLDSNLALSRGRRLVYTAACFSCARQTASHAVHGRCMGGRAYCVCSCGFPPAGEKAVCWLCRHCSFWDPGRPCAGSIRHRTWRRPPR